MPDRNPEDLHGLLGLREEALSQTALIHLIEKEVDFGQRDRRAVKRWIRVKFPQRFAEALHTMLGEHIEIVRKDHMVAHRTLVGGHVGFELGEPDMPWLTSSRWVVNPKRLEAAQVEIQHAITLLKLGARPEDEPSNMDAELAERRQYQTLSAASGKYLDAWAEYFGASRAPREDDEELRDRINRLKSRKIMMGIDFGYGESKTGRSNVIVHDGDDWKRGY